MLLSIIVNSYNTVDFISDCLHSVLPQLDENCELVVIDDGSTDGSIEVIDTILEEYNTKKSRNIVLQKNGGLGMARNAGIKAAVGKYIWFLDGDDEICSGAVSELLEEVKNDSEVNAYMFYPFHLRLNEEEPKVYFDPLIKGSYTDVNRFLKDTGVFLVTSWCFLYNRAFLESNRLEFAPITHEDNHFMLRFYNEAKSIKALGKAFYIYKARIGSSMKSKVSDFKLTSILEVIKLCSTMQPKNLSAQFLADKVYWTILEYDEAARNSDNPELYNKMLFDLIPSQKIYYNDPLGIMLRKIRYNLLKKI